MTGTGLFFFSFSFRMTRPASTVYVGALFYVSFVALLCPPLGCLPWHAPVSAQSTTTTTDTLSATVSTAPSSSATTLPSAPPSNASSSNDPVRPPKTISDVLFSDEDSLTTAQSMAVAASLVSGLSGNAMTSLYVARTSVLLTICREPVPGPVPLLQLPFVVKLGDRPTVQYYLGSALFNPFVVAISALAGLLLAVALKTSRGCTLEESMTQLHYPSTLFFPVAFLVMPGLLSAFTVLSQATSDDVLGITISSLVIVFWLALDGVAVRWLVRQRQRGHDAYFILKRKSDERGLTSKEIEWIDIGIEAGSYGAFVDPLLAAAVEAHDWGNGSASVLSPHRYGDFTDRGTLATAAGGGGGGGDDEQGDDGSGDGDVKRTGLVQALAGVNRRRHAPAKVVSTIDRVEDGGDEEMTQRNDAAAEGGDEDGDDGGDDGDDDNDDDAKGAVDGSSMRAQDDRDDWVHLTNADKAREVTDKVLANMFFFAQAIGGEEHALMMALNGRFRWVDRPESPGFCKRFGLFFGQFKKQYFFFGIVEIATSSVVGMAAGFYFTTSPTANCIVQLTGALAAVVVHLVLFIAWHPAFSSFHHYYCIIVTVGQIISLIVATFGAIFVSDFAFLLSYVVAILCVYGASLRAMMDGYALIVSLLNTNGDSWPITTKLTEMLLEHFNVVLQTALRRQQEGIASAADVVLLNAATSEGVVVDGSPPGSPKSKGSTAKPESGSPKKAFESPLQLRRRSKKLLGKVVSRLAMINVLLRTAKQERRISSRLVPPSLHPFHLVPLPPLITIEGADDRAAMAKFNVSRPDRALFKQALDTLRKEGEDEDDGTARAQAGDFADGMGRALKKHGDDDGVLSDASVPTVASAKTAKSVTFRFTGLAAEGSGSAAAHAPPPPASSSKQPARTEGLSAGPQAPEDWERNARLALLKDFQEDQADRAAKVAIRRAAKGDGNATSWLLPRSAAAARGAVSDDKRSVQSKKSAAARTISGNSTKPIPGSDSDASDADDDAAVERKMKQLLTRSVALTAGALAVLDSTSTRSGTTASVSSPPHAPSLEGGGAAAGGWGEGARSDRVSRQSDEAAGGPLGVRQRRASMSASSGAGRPMSLDDL